MHAETSMECLTHVANALDRALALASKRPMTPTAALLSRMSQEIAEQREALAELDEGQGWHDDASAAAPELAPRPAAGDDVLSLMPDPDEGDSVQTVPNDTRWSFSSAGFHFRVCAFRVLGGAGREDVPVTLLWRDGTGGQGRVPCTDVHAAFRHAAQLIATATLWSQFGE